MPTHRFASDAAHAWIGRPRCLTETGRRFAAAMQAAHNRCDLDLIDGARHAFIMPRYTAPEPMVVGAIRKADQFLASLGWLSGKPTLQVSDPTAWTEKPKAK